MAARMVSLGSDALWSVLTSAVMDAMRVSTATIRSRTASVLRRASKPASSELVSLHSTP